MSSQPKTMYKNVIVILIFTLFSKGIVFVREMQMASIFGANDITDAFNMASQITVMITEVFSTSITSCFIPILGSVLVETKESKVDKKYFNQLSSLMIVAILFMSLLCFVFSDMFREKIVFMLAPGFSGEKKELAAQLAHISLFGLLFLPVNCILTGVLSLYEEFRKTSFASLVLNVPPVLYLLVGHDIHEFLYFIIAGYAVQTLLLIIYAIKKGFRFESYFNLKDPYFKKFIFMIGPVLVGLGAKEVNTLIDRIMASTLASGELSLYNYASKLENVIHLILSTCFINVMFVVISKLEKSSEEFKSVISDVTTKMLAAVIPVTGLVFALADYYINLIFQRGKFTYSDTLLSSKVLMILSVGIIVYAYRDLLNRVFYSIGDTKTPTKVSILTIVINIIGNLILVRILGMFGLAIASILAASFTCIYLQMKLTKCSPGIMSRVTVREIFKLCAAGIFMTSILMLVKNLVTYFDQGIFSRLVIAGGFSLIGIAVYVFVLYLLKANIITEIHNTLMTKMRK